MMKCSKIPQEPSHANGTNDEAKKNGDSAQDQKSMTISDFMEHLERLQGVSNVASRLSELLREQINSLSHTIPIQRGHEMITDLKARVKSQRDGLKTAFDPLRDQIEQARAGFWAKHGEKLEAGLRDYVRKKVEQRVGLEIKRQLKRYEEYLGKNDMNTTRLKKAAEVSDVRLKNSLLRTKYPEEPVAWIGDLPEGIGPVITFDELIHADTPSASDLARSLGFSPAQDEDHLSIINNMMKYLGIAYKGLPSRGGVLLMPVKTNH